MKQIFYLFFVAVAFFACSKDSVKTLPGRIAGSVSDKTTGEPVATVNVSLSPGGQSTVTGNDGTFSFEELNEGTYAVAIRKEGYLSNDGKFIVQQGKQTPVHLLIERIPAVVTTDPKEIDFGSDASVNTLSFKIVNSSYEDLSWEIEYNCPWIQVVKPKSGTLKFGKTETIVVVIDRDLLDAGENKTVLVVRSSNGSSQVEVKAVGAERVLPVLNTLEVTDITRSSATLNGKILNAGIPAYMERGFVYNTELFPTLENTLKQITAPVTDSAVYSCRIEGLTLGTMYHVRAYAKSSKGVAYSANDISFVPSATVPVVTVQEVSDLNLSGIVTLNGRVSSAGDPPYIEKGFVYDDQPAPKINDNKVEVYGNETGPYSIQVTDFSLNKVFYVRAYIRQEENIYYSSETVHFILLPKQPSVSSTTVSEIDRNSVKLTASITEIGDPEYTEKGFILNIEGNPQIDKNIKKIPVNGTDHSSFSSFVNGLNSNTLYYVRAYVIQNGNAYYGNETSFKTTKQVPIVTTNAASDAMYTTATLNAIVTAIGDPVYNRRGFYYGTSSNPTAKNGITIIENANSFGDYSMSVTNLEESTTYYFRAFLLQPEDSDPILGEVKSFTTGRAPNVTTGETGNVTCSGTNENRLSWSTVVTGGLNDVGNPAYTEFGFVYGTNKLPIVNNGSSTYLTTTNFDQVSNARIFYATISGLVTGVHYYIRAVAKTPLGYVYGEPIEFVPVVIDPLVRTAIVECKKGSNGEWGAAFGARATLGQPASIAFGFVYGIIPSPGVDDGLSIAVACTKIEKHDNVYDFIAGVISGFQAGRTYYVRAYAKTQLKYTYGETLCFRTY